MNDQNEPAESATLPAVVEVQETGVAVPQVTIEDLIKAETGRFSLTPKRVKELTKKFAGLTINGVEDKAGYKKVTEALAIVRPERTRIAKEKKDIKERYAMVGKALDAREKELEAMIREVENPLQAEKDRIDDLIEEAKQREAREKAERERQRVQDVIAAGCVFDGEYYAIGNGVSIAAADIPNISGELWELFMSKVQEERDRLDIEAEEKRKEEEAAENKRKAEQEQLDADRKKLEEEKAELAASKKKARETVLRASGYKYEGPADGWVKAGEPVEGSKIGIAVSFNEFDVSEFSDDEFYGKIDRDVRRLEEMRADRMAEVAEEKAAKERETRKIARIAQVNDMGITQYDYTARMWYVKYGEKNEVHVKQDDVLNLQPEAWDAELNKVAAEMDHFSMLQKEAEQRRQEDAQREEDQRRENARKELPEVDQILNYLADLVKVPIPEITGYMAPHFDEFKALFKSAIERMTDKTKIITNAAGQKGEGGTE